jgi:DNA-binding SARP family transcriptional activator/tetratricopeptide (TPR) repeat protein
LRYNPGSYQQTCLSKMTHRLDIHLFGGFRLSFDGQPLSGFNSSRLQSLLAYLILHQDAPLPRQRLACLLWPDTSEEQARTNTRKTLHFLRRNLPDIDVFLSCEHSALWWRPDAPLAFDVAEFKAAIASENLERAVSLYAGDLLPDCYDEWVVDERERLRLNYLEVLGRLIRQKEDECDYTAALGFATRLLHDEPLREEIHRHIMQLYAQKGDRAAALHVYQECTALLQRELNVAPGPATRQLYESLLSNKGNSLQIVPLAGTFPLIGRAEEWAHLRETWQRVAQGNPRLVLISGEAGIGKTRLVEELLVWVNQQGLSVASASCYAAEGASAYAPVMSWLRTRNLAHLEPAWRSEVARLLPEIASEPVSTTALGTLTQTWQLQRFHEALARAILGPDLGENQPLLLILEDVQWCDGDTLTWLNYFLRYNPAARLMVVCTLRSEAMPENGPLLALLSDLRHHNLLIEIGLQALDLPEATQLGEAALGQALETEVAADLYRETEGNPLYIVEFARAGLTSTAANGAGTLALPPLVQAAIVSHLARLSRPAQHVMHLAAVIGREFTYNVLQRALQQDEDTLVDALDELWQRRVIRERDNDTYDFSHDKLRQMAYSQLSTARKRSYHRRIAEALSDLYAKQTDLVSGQIGWHYEQAGDKLAAVEWLWKAGDRSAKVGAYVEAVAYLKRTLALLPVDDQRRAELLCRIGNESAIPYGGDQEMDYVQQGLALAQQIGDRHVIARASLSMSRVLSNRGDNIEATRLAGASLTHAEGIGDQETMGRALSVLGAQAYYRREYARALHYLQESLTIFQNLDDSQVQDISHSRTRVLNYMGLTCLDQQEFEQARQHWQQALELSEKNGDRPAQAMVVNNLAWMALVRGEYEEAESRQLYAIRLYRELGDHGGLAVSYNTLGHVAVHKGFLEAAQNNYYIGLREATYFSTTPMVLETLAGLAGLWARTGNAVRAAEILGLAISHQHTSPEVNQVAPYSLQLLQEVMARDELEAALQRGRRLDLEQVLKELLKDAETVELKEGDRTDEFG